jgi:hypothetical protein
MSSGADLGFDVPGVLVYPIRSADDRVFVRHVESKIGLVDEGIETEPVKLVKTGRSQPVGATPSDMNSFSKGGVYGPRKTEQASGGTEDRDVAMLEVWTVVA